MRFQMLDEVGNDLQAIFTMIMVAHGDQKIYHWKCHCSCFLQKIHACGEHIFK
jgi:hypothetical protein